VTSPTDGARFRAELPASDYRVTVNNLPSGYVLKSLTVDSADLLKDSLKVDVVPKRSKPSLQVTLAVDPTVWIQISGRVTTAGKLPQGVNSVSISNPAFAEALSVRLDSKGAFVFPQVLPGTYTLRVGSAKEFAETTIVAGPGGVSDLVIETDTISSSRKIR
jgi:hypothetical protein